MIRVLLIFLFLGLSIHANALIITGSAPDYRGKEIQLIGFTDLISFRQQLLATAKVDEHGLFQINYDPKHTSRFYLRIGFISAPIYLEPGKNIVVYFPGPDKNQPITAGFSHTVNVTFDTTKVDLNLKILRFNREVDAFLTEGYELLIQRKAGRVVKVFVNEMESRYSKATPKFFKDYVMYSLGNIEQLAFVNRDALFKKHLYRKEILYHQPEYMNFFNQYFDDYLPQFAISLHGYKIKDLINKGTSPEALKKIMSADSLLFSDQFKELVLLKGLPELYYNKDFNRTHVAGVLKQIAEKSIYPEHKVIASSLYHITERLSPGQDIPQFSFRDINGKSISTSSLGGKPFVIYFWSSECGECVRELSVLREFESKYPGVNFVYVGLDENEKKQKQIYTTTQLGGVKVSNASSFELRDQFGVWSVPYTQVFDRYGRVITNTAPLPSEGLEKIIFESVK